MKKIITLFLGIVILVGVLLVGKNVIAKVAIEQGVRMVTGLGLKMEDFDFSLTKSYVGIKGLHLFNPSGYPDRVMVDLPVVYIDYEFAPLLQGKGIHVEEIRVHLREFTAVRNEKGKLNVDTLKPVQKEKKEAREKTAQPVREPAGKPAEVKVDNLMLRIERVTFKDYSAGGEPSVKEYNLNLNEEYHNIKNLNQVVSIIIIKIMMHTPLAALTNFNVGALQGNVTDALASSRKLASDTALKAMKQVENTDFSSAQKTVEEAASQLTGGVKGLTGAFKSKLPNPFAEEEEQTTP